MGMLLWILALICIVFGVINLVQGAILWGIVLIVVGMLIGGYGPFANRP